MRQGKTALRRGFTLIELLVVIGIIAILIAILLPVAERVRHKAYIADCGSNLRELGQAIAIYCNENHGNYPRTLYVPGAPLTKGTGATAPDPFTPPASGGPQANDTTAPLFLLMRAEKLPPKFLLCPYNDVNEFTPDPINPMLHGNFTDWTKNLGYSFANPYPDTAAKGAGYQLTGKTGAQFAIAADLNPGIHPPYDDVSAAQPGSPWSQTEKANSENHEKDGQNVLYGDGHVVWTKTPLVGVNNDNIYMNGNAQVWNTPMSRDDSVLLPAEN